jgi:hypothetical protein
MNDKMFDLMEKMYSELSTFKTDVTTEFKGIRQDLKGLNIKVDKNTMLLENLTAKSEIISEVQKSHMEQNENAHKDIVIGMKLQS